MAKKCRCNIISFGNINLYLLLVPLAAILDTVIDQVTGNSKKFGQKGAEERQHPIMLTINYALGLCLSFIPLTIYKIRNKRNKKMNIFLVDKAMNNHNITNKEKFLWILLGSILDFIAKVIYYYNWIESGDYLNYNASNILLMSLFSYWLLKTKLYKHHYLSIGVTSIIGIATNFVWKYFTLDAIKQNYIGYIMYFVAESIINILYVLYKFFMFKKFIKSYAILTFQGLIELILGITILLLSTKYFDHIDSYIEYFKDIDGSEIAIFFSLIIIHFLTYIIVFIVIDVFTPFYLFLINILSEIMIKLLDGKILGYKTEMAIYLIFLIISIFMILIFTEIIQLNFCGLSKMTKINIEKRAELDTIDSNSYIENDDNDIVSENDNDIVNNSDNRNSNINSNRFTYSGYTFELTNIKNNENPNKLIPSDNE